MLIYMIYEIVLIVAYLYKNVIMGLLAWFLIMLWHKKRSMSAVDFWVGLIISAVPISYLEVTCEIGSHIFKWYNFAVIGLILSLFKRKMLFSKKALTILIASILLQLARTLFSKDLGAAFIEIFQEYILILPIFLLWSYLKHKKEPLETEINVEKWMNIFKNTVSASAIGVLIQYVVYIYSGRVIGYATIWTGRQVFDLTFTGYSVLSVYLGLGMVLAVKDILMKRDTWNSLFVFVVSALACAINSSRSGFLAAIVIVAIMVMFAMIDSKKSVRALAFGVPIAMIVVAALVFFISARESVQNGNLLFANGRDNLMRHAFEMLGSDLGILLFGIGINGVSELGLSSQHNMFLEFWTLNGSILFLVFFVVVLLILWKTRKVESRYMLWQLVLAHQFFSSFFATTFTLPILCIVAGEYYLKRCKKQNSLLKEEPRIVG